MAAKQAIGMNGMADVFVGSDTHLRLVKYSERQSAEITKQRGFLARLRKHNSVGRGGVPRQAEGSAVWHPSQVTDGPDVKALPVSSCPVRCGGESNVRRADTHRWSAQYQDM